MTQWCETCGQDLPDGHHDEVWLTTPDGGPAPPVPKRPKGSDRSVLKLVAAGIAVWVLFVGVSALVSSGDDAAAPVIEEPAGTAEPEAEPTATDIESPPAEPSPGDDAEVELAEAADDEVEVINDIQVGRLARQLQRRQIDIALAYRSDEGVALVDLRGGTTQVLDLGEATTSVDPSLALLRSGTDTFGIDPETFAAVQVVDDSSIVVTSAALESTFYVGADGLRSQAPLVEVLTAEGESSGYLTPAGHQLIALEGLGLIAVPKGPTGGTLIAGLDGFEPLSDHRVLTANPVAMLEQVCETPIQCSLVVTGLDGDLRWEVPSDFSTIGDTYRLAPDGMALLRITPTGYAEFVSSDHSVLWVIGAGMDSPVWGPDSTFIAWLDFIGEPTLKVMFVDEPDWLTIDIADLGGSRPVGHDLMLLPLPLDPASAG